MPEQMPQYARGTIGRPVQPTYNTRMDVPRPQKFGIPGMMPRFAYGSYPYNYSYGNQTGLPQYMFSGGNMNQWQNPYGQSNMYGGGNNMAGGWSQPQQSPFGGGGMSNLNSNINNQPISSILPPPTTTPAAPPPSQAITRPPAPPPPPAPYYPPEPTPEVPRPQAPTEPPLMTNQPMPFIKNPVEPEVPGITTLPDEAYQNLPFLRFLQNFPQYKDMFNTMAPGQTTGAFGMQLPEAGALNYRQISQLAKNPVSWQMASAAYDSASRDLPTIANLVKQRAPLGNAVPTSLIRTR